MDWDNLYPHIPINYCKLFADGAIVKYDACDSSPSAYDPKKFELLGPGYIWMVDGVKQSYTDEDQLYFYRYTGK